MQDVRWLRARLVYRRGLASPHLVACASKLFPCFSRRAKSARRRWQGKLAQMTEAKQVLLGNRTRPNIYGKISVCRVPGSLPWATSPAHGKHNIYRVPDKKLTVKIKHMANWVFAECDEKTHGKMIFCRVPNCWHTAKSELCRELSVTHGKIGALPSVFIWHTTNLISFFSSFAS